MNIDTQSGGQGVEGQTFSHYRVIEKLGEGGMGEVYLAEDTSLKRKVALKVLPEAHQQDPVSHKRFIREAESAAALDHPYVCKIYEVGEHEGRNFIAMEYLRGLTLKERLSEGPVPLDEALRIASEIAEALEEAHEGGIVHRDLKPSNIMLTPKGHAQVLDFGLAKKVFKGNGSEQDITSTLTGDGSTLGTLPYMSPEQIKAQSVDQRSDIFSFGVVLFEMLTGVHPFRKDVQIATITAILRDDPLALSQYVDECPALLAHLISKTLAKAPEQRYQLIHEVRTDLNRVKRELELVGFKKVLQAEAIPEERVRNEIVSSIAVLPFKDMSPEKNQDYFCEGIAEEIINALTHVGRLRVVARTSAFSFKGKEDDIREIGVKLNAETLLEGSVRKAGERIRITAQLIDVKTGFHIWSQRFDRKLGDVFEIQDEISLSIAEQLELELVGEEKRAIVRRYTEDTEAYLAYLKGRHHFLSMRDSEQAIESFKKAIMVDANYAPAYAMLAIVYGNLVAWGGQPKGKFLPLMKEMAGKALEMDASLAESRLALAFFKCFEQDFSAVDRETARAIQLNPTLPEGYVFRATLLFGMLGRSAEVLAELRKALELDPLSAWIHFWIGNCYYCARSNDDAILHFRMSLQLDPGLGISHWWLGLTYLQEEMFTEAVAEFESIGAGQHPYVLARLGKTDQAIKALKSGQWDRIAQTLVALGRKDEAFVELERAIWSPETPCWCEEAAVMTDPVWDPLRTDPRFPELLSRIGLDRG